ncbi:MAG TPA: flavodoxin-dependent (E)-4-hydroxy-3-methylbut-2-enyl-diphosphate synthase [Chitinivibrionales bacterium]|jgi:(E)-4-hydroxy-3-methylbut-2-enyl-diphosphate synthase|nr:flavodoxin-dependent (E)-4-hydroxy-3-methylbut-2-enyl-diphosphate synthase [Chitinivibrionales bacterium]
MITRKKTRQVLVRGVTIGGGAPISVQSMTNTLTEDVEATLAQIKKLSDAGCKIVRIAVPNKIAAEAFAKIRKQTKVPLVADIHFQHELAIAAIEAGADKVRINPGNIGSADKVKKVVDAAKAARIPLRIGVNSGSLEKQLLAKHGGPTPEALVESALGFIAMMDSFDFSDIVLSIKASDVLTTVEACRLLSQATNVPQHIGITESGTLKTGTIRSSVGIGALLSEGIGDTLRVSLCSDPVNEVRVATEILKSLGLAQGPTVLACPTCGRTQINVEALAEKVEAMVSPLTANIKIAVMGCVVNGPGEAADADVGIAGGKHEGQIFLKGKMVEKVPEEKLVEVLMGYVEKLIKDK